LYDVVVKKFTFSISYPDEFLYCLLLLFIVIIGMRYFHQAKVEIFLDEHSFCQTHLHWKGGSPSQSQTNPIHCRSSGVTEGGQRGAVAPGRSRQGGAKQPGEKCIMTNDHKAEFDYSFLNETK